jgi:hypothetical protein
VLEDIDGVLEDIDGRGSYAIGAQRLLRLRGVHKFGHVPGSLDLRRSCLCTPRVPGDHVLSCRATDATGDAQPLEPPWNFQGMGNNLVQEVYVTVR